MKALVEEHKKFSLADMDIDEQQNETHKDLEMQLQSFDMATLVYYNGISCTCQIKRQLGKNYYFNLDNDLSINQSSDQSIVIRMHAFQRWNEGYK